MEDIAKLPRSISEITLSEDHMFLTHERLEALRTSKGGVTKKIQTFLIGREKPKKGWFKRCIGIEVSKKEYAELLDYIKGNW